MKKEWYIGIDVSKDTLDVSIFTTKASLADFPHKKFENNKKGFVLMLAWLRTNEIKPKDAAFCLEYTGYYSWEIRNFLDRRKFTYRIENPLEIKFRSGVTTDKNDRIDSARIADYLYRYSDRLTPSKLPNENLVYLDALKKERKHYVEQRTALMNRVQVTRYKDEQRRHLKLIEQMNKMIQAVENKMKEVLDSDESLKINYTLLITISGIGFVNAVNTIVNTENFTSFKTARQYASYVGVAPHSKTSGKRVKWKSKPSKYCDLRSKADLSQAAQSAAEYDPEMKRFYKRKTKYSNSSDTIRKTMNAVKFKLIQRMFAVVRRGTPFEKMIA